MYSIFEQHMSMFGELSIYNFAKQLSWVRSEFPIPQANQHDGIMSVNNINPLSRTAKLQRGDLSICLCAILAWLTNQLFRHCKNQTYITYCLTVRICLLHIRCPKEFVRFQQSAYCLAVFWVLEGKFHKTEKEDGNFKMMLILDHSQAVGLQNESTETIFE